LSESHRKRELLGRRFLHQRWSHEKQRSEKKNQGKLECFRGLYRQSATELLVEKKKGHFPLSMPWRAASGERIKRLGEVKLWKKAFSGKGKKCPSPEE